MEQEDITLRGQSRAQKDACHVFSNLYVDLMEVDNGVMATRAWEWRGWRRVERGWVAGTSRELSGMRSGFPCSKAQQSSHCWQLSTSTQQQVDRIRHVPSAQELVIQIHPLVFKCHTVFHKYTQSLCVDQKILTSSHVVTCPESSPRRVDTGIRAWTWRFLSSKH